MTRPKVSEIASAVERWYPAELAEEWDQIGLAVGSGDIAVEKILLTVDLTLEILASAVSVGANLVISHHPLDLTDLPEVVTQQHIAQMIEFAAKHQLSIYVAHTNADHGIDGVSDALIASLGVIPEHSVTQTTSLIGTGRVGKLQKPMPLVELARLLAAKLPKNQNGIRFTGNPANLIQRIAVCGGSGASLLPILPSLAVDAYITADLKHHAVLDHQANSSIALINVSHWASEWLWLAVLAKKLNQEFPLVPTVISEICTDPWTGQISGVNSP
ncbi:MAG: hypothetical protein RIT32_840 [Actinomycetota bacterium]|jgi:dinuclear metal center YbgI/SA1388 family protein